MNGTKLILRDLRLHCLIGVDPAERRIRQPLLVDADIVLAAADGGGAADDTPLVDYRAAADALRKLAKDEQFGLMETFAQKAAETLLEFAGAAAVRIYCRKPAPFADLGAAGAEVSLP